MPEATVVIVTKDRRERLRAAVASALEQEGDVEVLVVDDGSSDGTAEMVRAAFPTARVERFATSAGLVARRNDAAALARGRVLVSIDDDATFSTPRVVADTVRDFDADPRVAVVAIPYVDVTYSDAVLQRAPDDERVWVAPVFRGTAYAALRDVFLRCGGFRAAVVHQGEEHDLALRLLDAGRLIRLGRADPILHREEPRRDFTRMDVYGRRNEILLSSTRLPLPYAPVAAAIYAARGLVHGLRVRRPRNMVRGIRDGVRDAWAMRAERSPVSWAAVRADRALRRAGALPADDVAARLSRAAGAEAEAG